MLSRPEWPAQRGSVSNNAFICPIQKIHDEMYPGVLFSSGCRPYNAPGAGLGGSAAHALLNGKDPVQSELDLGVGWQDPAVIRETGLCVWRSGSKPVLDFKVGLMAGLVPQHINMPVVTRLHGVLAFVCVVGSCLVIAVAAAGSCCCQVALFSLHVRRSAAWAKPG